MTRLLQSLLLICFIFLSACSSKEEDSIQVGTIAGPETVLMETARDYLKKTQNIDMHIVEFSDYSLPNTALYDGSIDANMFQHQPYLDVENKARGYDLIAIGKTFIYPMGIYSKNIKDLKKLPPKSTVAIPNDPTNEARALLLLHKAKLIKVNDKDIISLTPNEIVENPLALKFVELDAAQLPRSLEDVSLAVINTNYAIPAGLIPKKDALYLESKDSPYANIIVVKENNAKNSDLLKIVQAMHSDEVQAKARALFKNQAIPAWQ